MVLKETPVWSKKANEIVQKAIDCAIQMKFENTVEFRLMNRHELHHFGQLTCQKPDGTWIDLTKCLSNAFLTKTTTSEFFAANVYQMESIRQPEWKTDDEIPLTVKMVAAKHIPRPMATDVDAAALNTSNQSTENSTPAENASAVNNVKVAENKAKKKSSAPTTFEPFQAKPIWPYMANQYAPGPVHMRRGGHGFFRGGFVNYRKASRDRNYHHHGRMRAQSDQEYFESCFRKQPNPKKPSSKSSSDVDESNDESHDNKQATGIETKQEQNSNKSTENANEHESQATTTEVKNDAAAVETTDTAPITAVTATTTMPAFEVSVSPPVKANTADVDVNKSVDNKDEQKVDK